jgi:hypothetical protein
LRLVSYIFYEEYVSLFYILVLSSNVFFLLVSLV